MQEGVISLVMTTALIYLHIRLSEGMRGGRTEEKCVSVIGGRLAEEGLGINIARDLSWKKHILQAIAPLKKWSD